MEIKDYLHLYLGCDVLCLIENRYGTLQMAHATDFGYLGIKYKEFGNGLIDFAYRSALEFKLILRPLSDMKGNEAIDYFDLPKGVQILRRNIIMDMYLEFDYRFKNENEKLNNDDGYSYSSVAIAFDGRKIDNYPEKLLWLLYRHFDLFGLIDAGLAIDATKVTAKQNKEHSNKTK